MHVSQWHSNWHALTPCSTLRAIVAGLTDYVAFALAFALPFFAHFMPIHTSFASIHV